MSGETDRLYLRLLGRLEVHRGALALPVPASRKTRAILGFLALSPRPVSRQRLCDLFFDIPDDPRAALRWSLTKIRPLVDEPGRPRLLAERDALRLDLAGAEVDAHAALATAAQPLAELTSSQRQRALDQLSADLLEDCDLPDRPEYTAWLAAQRQDFRAIALKLASAEAQASEGEARISALRRLLALDPLDEAAAASLARALMAAGRRDEAHALAATTERQLRQAGLQAGPTVRLALRSMPPDIKPAPASASAIPTEPIDDGRISVGVIPFLNHSPDAIPDELMDGLLEAVAHMLSKFRDIRVAGFSGAMQFKGAIKDPSAMGEALGVSHLAGGSVMVRNGALKIRYRLVAAADGALIASGDVDHDAADAFALLEDAPARLVVLLAHHLANTARDSAIAKPENRRTAFEHFLAGVHFGFFATPISYSAALAAFEAGLALTPEDPNLNAFAAWAKAGLGQGLREPERTQALAQAHRAIATADNNADALAVAAWSAVHLAQDFDAGLRAVELATRLNPLSRIAWSLSAWIRAMAGEFETPMRHWDIAARCNPLESSIDHALAGRALCSWMAGRFEDAADAAKRALERQPSGVTAHMTAVAAAVALGDPAQIKAAVDAMTQSYPDAPETPAMASIPIRSSETKTRLLQAIRSARGQATGHIVDDGQLKSGPGRANGLPVVAVLPFADLSAEPLPSYVSAGFFDGVTHALSRFRSLIVISAASTSALARRLEDPKLIADSLGADILVGGSLMSASDGRLRLRWRAVEGATGRALTLGDIEGALRELWDLQERAACAIAVEVEPRAQAETLRARGARPTTSNDAYDLYLQGLFAGFSLESRDYRKALDLFESALALDPKFHPALAMAPWAAAYANAILSPDDLARFARMSRDALTFGRDDARTQATAGTALFYMAHEFAAARKAIERAIALNPNEYTAWICGGWMHAMKAEADAAHAMFDRAERLNPLAYGANGLMSGRAMAEFMAGRFKDAERYIEHALAGDDSHPSALMTGIATAHVMGLADACKERCRAFLSIYPDGLASVAIQALPFEDAACRESYFSAVQKGLNG